MLRGQMWLFSKVNHHYCHCRSPHDVIVALFTLFLAIAFLRKVEDVLGL